MFNAESNYQNFVAPPGTDVRYFTQDQGAELSAWIKAANGQAVVVAHSWGADTAATVVAAGATVSKLVTLDPVSYARPDYAAVAANAGEWRDYNATGGGLTFPNAVAGIGSSWGTTPQGYASTFANVNVDHAQTAGGAFMSSLMGTPH